MFVTKKEITKAADAVYALTTGLKRGDVLTHESISEVLGLIPHEGSWGHVMRRVRRRLEDERGIATWPEVTVGYKLCTVEEQLALPAKRMKRAVRQARRGRRSVEALPDKNLTLHQKRMKAFMSDRIRDAETAMRREAREQALHLKPTPSLPRAKPAPTA